MYQLASTTVSVLRGTTTNAYGDVVDSGTVHQAGIPAFLEETAQSVFDQATQTPRVVRTWHATLPYGTDVTETDQLRDDRTSVVYIVETVVRPQIPGRYSDVEVDLRNVT